MTPHEWFHKIADEGLAITRHREVHPDRIHLPAERIALLIWLQKIKQEFNSPTYNVHQDGK